MRTSRLAEPLELPCGATIANRIAKAAMTEGLAGPDDRPTAGLAQLYRSWSEGGAGLLITGNVMVDRRYLERPGNVVLEHAGDLDTARPWAEAGTAAGNQLWMQINHPGRQCHRLVSARPPAPSGVRLDLGSLFGRPVPMTSKQIEDTIERFANTAALAQRAGFTGVQIHAAHGYLLSQFLSPLANRRLDGWGGSLANRARLLLEIVRAVRAAVGCSFAVAVKLNSADFQRGGFSTADSLQVARWLDTEGIDLLEVSGGTYEQTRFLGHVGKSGSAEAPRRASTAAREAYFLEYARRIRETVDLPVMVTGGFRTPAVMANAVESGSVDLVGLARPFVLDPGIAARLIADGEPGPAPRAALAFGTRWPRMIRDSLPIRLVNVQGEAAWYYRQMLRLASGLEPAPELGLLSALAYHYRDELRLLRRRAA